MGSAACTLSIAIAYNLSPELLISTSASALLHQGNPSKPWTDKTAICKLQNLLITASDKPVALAGVMGGESTEVHEGTQNLVLEAAIFDQATIRRSARAQGLRSESSIRYERGVNQAALTTACNRAVALILELAGGAATVQKTASSGGDDLSFSRIARIAFRPRKPGFRQIEKRRNRR